MKIIYIGTKDQLAEAFIERMNKEGNDVYFLSDVPFSRKASDILKHRYYKSSLESGSVVIGGCLWGRGQTCG